MKVKDTSELRRVETGRTDETRKTERKGTTAADKVSTEAKGQVEAAATAARQALGSNRAVRLEAIEAAIRQGTFKPDPARIAQRILDEAEVTAMLQSMLGGK
jgi:negative regulator of flagellin synthesis FlgM